MGPWAEGGHDARGAAGLQACTPVPVQSRETSHALEAVAAENSGPGRCRPPLLGAPFIRPCENASMRGVAIFRGCQRISIYREGDIGPGDRNHLAEIKVFRLGKLGMDAV